MVGEKVKVENFDILQFVNDNAWLSTFEAIEKAYNAGVSEQETVLDKIRAEIIDLANAYDYQQAFNHGLMRAVQIIDKYKAESEVQE